MKTRPSATEILTELGLALLAVHTVILAVLQRYSLKAVGLPLSFQSPTLPLVLAFLLLGLRVWLNRRRPPRKWNGPERLRPGWWLSDLSAPGWMVASGFLLVFFLFHHYGGRLGSDGVMYYIYVRSLVIDGDLDFTNEFEDFVPSKFQHIAEEARALDRPPDPSNEPGPALLWAPAFLLAHWVVKVMRWMGTDIAADGYSYPYINAVCVTSLLWGFVAVVVAYRVCRRFFSAGLAAVSVIALWLSSTLFWYTVVEPSMPHATAAASVSLFLYLWLRARDDPSVWRWILVGLAGGLILSMQRYNVFYLLAPLVTATGMIIHLVRKGDRLAMRRWLWTFGTMGAAILLAALPMLLYNFFVSRERSFLRLGNLAGFTLRNWDHPKIAEFLFSSNSGLFSWTPITILAVLGLFLFLRKDPRLAGTLLLTLAGGIYLLSSTWDWYAGYAFGSRRLTEGFLIFALGFCAVAEVAIKRPKILAAGFIGFLMIWNFLLVDQVKRGEVPMMGTFSFSEAASRSVRRFYDRFGHPASFPASWLFAWKYGVSPGRFDPVYGHRSYHNLTIDVGAPDDAYFLGHGWSLPEVSAEGVTYRWSVGEESSWLVPLFEPHDYILDLTGEPSRNPEGRRQTISIGVNGRRAGTLTLNEGFRTVETRIPAAFWKEGINEVGLRYGWTVEAGSVYGGEDPRQIAFRMTRLRLRVEK